MEPCPRCDAEIAKSKFQMHMEKSHEINANFKLMMKRSFQPNLSENETIKEKIPKMEQVVPKKEIKSKSPAKKAEKDIAEKETIQNAKKDAAKQLLLQEVRRIQEEETPGAVAATTVNLERSSSRGGQDKKDCFDTYFDTDKSEDKENTDYHPIHYSCCAYGFRRLRNHTHVNCKKI